MSRISGLFARRGFNIDSLAVGPAESKGISRLTMVVEGDDETLQQMTKQLNKLFNVLGVVDFTNLAAVERELMLLKVSSKEILKNYNKIKKINKSKNIVIGFGITSKTIASLKRADGLVVGSALCKEISKSIKNKQNPVTKLGNMVKRLKTKLS